MAESFNLERFKSAQDRVYHRVVMELRQGRKQSHWMWFIFPQIQGLGTSATAKAYAIKNQQEARAYLADPLLGGRLVECCQLLMELEGKTATEIFGKPDDIKLRSSLSLFASVSEEGNIYQQLLDKYFDGAADELTLEIIKSSTK